MKCFVPITQMFSKPIAISFEHLAYPKFSYYKKRSDFQKSNKSERFSE